MWPAVPNSQAMKRPAAAVAVLAAMAALAVTASCAPNEDPVDTSELLALDKAITNASPNPIDFGAVPVGSTKTIVVTVQSTSENDVRVVQATTDPAEHTSVNLDTCTLTTIGNKNARCTVRFTLDLTAADSPPSGEGVLTLLATSVQASSLDIGSFDVAVPYRWSAPAEPTTVPAPSSTDAPATSTTALVATTIAATTLPTSTAPANAGTPAIAVSPTAHNFGSVPYRTAAVPFKVTNTGGGLLRFSSFRLAAGQREWFYIGNNTCQGASLAAGKSCVISVGVADITSDTSPTPGAHSDTLTIASNAGSVTVALGYTTPG